MHSSTASVLQVKMPWVRFTQNQYYLARCYLPVVLALISEKIQVVSEVFSATLFPPSHYLILDARQGETTNFTVTEPSKGKHICALNTEVSPTSSKEIQPWQ